jgi:hypothetical protein
MDKHLIFDKFQHLNSTIKCQDLQTRVMAMDIPCFRLCLRHSLILQNRIMFAATIYSGKQPQKGSDAVTSEENLLKN